MTYFSLGITFHVTCLICVCAVYQLEQCFVQSVIVVARWFMHFWGTCR